MFAEDQNREEAIFNAARRITDPDSRIAYLDAQCGGDTSLRNRIGALLDAHESETAFLETAGYQIGEETFGGSVEPIGPVIGQYRLGEQIGSGGFGIVFEAKQLAPVQRQVALKLLKPGMDSHQVVARFEAERQTLACMDHSNIAKVLDAGETEAGQPYFVMELVQGVPITEFCESHQLTVKQRLNLFIDVCDAVQHAHQKGVIHRDIKPTNVLVAKQQGNPLVKVIDFGVAKAIGENSAAATYETQWTQLIGTPLYMSPEQMDLGSADIDTRADVYALGVLLYELLTGTTPFERKRFKAAGLDEIRRIIQEQTPTKPSSRIAMSTPSTADSSRSPRQTDLARLERAIRGDLDWIVMKCLEKHRDRRYSSALGVAADIRRHLDGDPVEAGPPSASYRVSKFVRKHRTLFSAASAIAIVLVLATIVSGWQAIRATQAQQSERSERIKAQYETARADEEASIAVAVNQLFLDDLLSQADIANQPTADRNPEITVRELVNRAAERFEKEFAGPRSVEAAVRETLGRALYALGDFDSAVEHLTRSLGIRRQDPGPNDDATLETELVLAELRIRQGQLDLAKTLLDHVVRTRRRKDGDNDPNTLRAQNILGVCLIKAGEFEAAESLLVPTLDRRRVIRSKGHPEILESMHTISNLYLEQGKYSQAEPLARECYDLRLQRLGADHPSTLSIMNTLAVSLIRIRRYEEADQLLRTAKTVCTNKLGEYHPQTLDVTSDLAVLCELRGLFQEAEEFYQAVVAGRIDRLGPDHRATLSDKNNLATFFAVRGRPEDAEPILKSILALQMEDLGPDHPETLLTLNNLGFLYQTMNRLEEAEEYAVLAVDAAIRRLTLKHPTTRILAHNLFLIRFRLNRPEKCEARIRDLIQTARSETGPRSIEYAIEITWLAECLIRQGKFREAELWAQEAVAIREELNPDGWTHYYSLALWGTSLSGQGKIEQAEPILLRGCNGMKDRVHAIPAESSRVLTWSIEQIVKHFESAGKTAEQAIWERELADLISQ